MRKEILNQPRFGGPLWLFVWFRCLLLCPVLTRPILNRCCHSGFRLSESLGWIDSKGSQSQSQIRQASVMLIPASVLEGTEEWTWWWSHWNDPSLWCVWWCVHSWMHWRLNTSIQRQRPKVAEALTMKFFSRITMQRNDDWFSFQQRWRLFFRPTPCLENALSNPCLFVKRWSF